MQSKEDRGGPATAPPPTMAELPPNRLRELREGAGLKLYDIAARLRVDPSTVHRWEAGGAVPDTAKLALADFYGVTPTHLMGWPESAAA